MHSLFISRHSINCLVPPHRLPQDDFTVQDVKRLVGPRRVVDVMDTRTQEASTMTLSQWAKYYDTKPRQKLLNVISLEFSCTKLAPLVQPPIMVSQSSIVSPDTVISMLLLSEFKYQIIYTTSITSSIFSIV